MVDSGETKCVVVRTSNGEPRLAAISGNYDCLDDDLDPKAVSAYVQDPRGRQVWKSYPGKSEGKFRVVGRGRYKFCIANGVEPNQQSDGKERTVGFSIRIRDLVTERKELADKAKKERQARLAESQAKENKEGGEKDEEEAEDSKNIEKADLMSELAEDLIDRIDDIKDHLSYQRERNEAHRDLAESTFSRIVNWWMFEAVALLIVTGGQILYLRWYVEKRSYF